MPIPSPVREQPSSPWNRDPGWAIPAFWLLVLVLGLAASPFGLSWPGLSFLAAPAGALADASPPVLVVRADWEGHGAPEVQYRITAKLVEALLAMPGVVAIQGLADEGAAFVIIEVRQSDLGAARARVLERLSGLAAGALPDGVRPGLAPEADPAGWLCLYALEPVDAAGIPVVGVPPEALRALQDGPVRRGLLSVGGVAAVASLGNGPAECRIDLDPARLLAYGVSLDQARAALAGAFTASNAGVLSVNRAGLAIRGTASVKGADDLRSLVVGLADGKAVRLGDLATVSLGTAADGGLLQASDARTVGGVVYPHRETNALVVSEKMRQRLADLEKTLPEVRAHGGAKAKVRLVPVFDRVDFARAGLAASRRILAGAFLLVFVAALAMTTSPGAALAVTVAGACSVAVGLLAMRLLTPSVDLPALAGLIVFVGAFCAPAVTQALGEGRTDEARRASLATGLAALAGLGAFACLGPVETTLYRSLAVGLAAGLAGSLVAGRTLASRLRRLLPPRLVASPGRLGLAFEGLLYLGGVLAVFYDAATGGVLAGAGLLLLAGRFLAGKSWRGKPLFDLWRTVGGFLALATALILAVRLWLPLGPAAGLLGNLLPVAGLFAGIVFALKAFVRYAPRLLDLALRKPGVIALPAAGLIVCGLLAWLGARTCVSPLPAFVRESSLATALAETFPGLGHESLPPLAEGAYLLRSSLAPQVTLPEARDILDRQCAAARAVPEVDRVVGRVGRSDSPLDLAGAGDMELLVRWREEFRLDAAGNVARFRYDPHGEDVFRDEAGRPVPAPDGQPYRVRGRFVRDTASRLIPDPGGAPFRLWRPALDPGLDPGRAPWPGIRHPDDIREIIWRATRIVGLATGPGVEPLRSGIPGLTPTPLARISGPDAGAVQKAAIRVEEFLRALTAIEPARVTPDSLGQRPVVTVDVDRLAAARLGLNPQAATGVVEAVLGGREMGGFEVDGIRYGVRLRYGRLTPADIEALRWVPVDLPAGRQTPLGGLVSLGYGSEPVRLRSQGAALVCDIAFGGRDGPTDAHLADRVAEAFSAKMHAGELELEAGTSVTFLGGASSGRETGGLAWPGLIGLAGAVLVLAAILRSRAALTAVLAEIAVAFAGGFVLSWLYGQPWFLDVSVFGVNVREVLAGGPVATSPAFWAGSLALSVMVAGNAALAALDVVSTLGRSAPMNREDVRQAVLAAGIRRTRPFAVSAAIGFAGLALALTARVPGTGLLAAMAVPVLGGLAVWPLGLLVGQLVMARLAGRPGR